MASLAASIAESTPLLKSIGFIPAATNFKPSVTIALVSTVAVVVPSPATSFVLLAASRTIWAPMFSNLSFNSISFATETPSFVLLGAPKDLSITTFLPLGPNVTATASAKTLTPLSILFLASVPKCISLPAIFYSP